MSYLENAKKLRPTIETAMSMVDDNTALKAPQLCKPWVKDEKVHVGDRRYYKPNKLLYKVRQEHTTQADWTPDITPNLYSVVAKEETGTITDPITAVRGMEYQWGLYYLDPEDQKVYLCKYGGGSTGSVITLYYLPHELIGHYFEEINT